MNRLLLCCGSLLACSCLGIGQQSSPTATPGAANPGMPPPYATPPTLPDSKTPAQPQSSMPPDQAAPPASGSQNDDTNKLMSLQGCLTQVGTGFTLADKNSGSFFQLRGDNVQLSKFVNQEVKVKGATQIATPSAKGVAGEHAGQNASISNTFTVSSVEKISDQCKTK